jgi:hypothetical protein
MKLAPRARAFLLEVLMKTIVLVVLVVVAGCGGKKGPDCNESVAKGIEAATATLGGHSTSPQMMASMVSAMNQLKVAVTKRCTEDKWPAEVVNCFGGAKDMGDLQGCQSRLDKDLRDKLNADIREIRNSRQRTPDVPGHPPTLSPGSGAAPGSPDTGSAAPAGAPAPTGAAEPAAGSAAPPAAPATGGTVVPAVPPAGSAAGSGDGW